jgi:hypothetical protein
MLLMDVDRSSRQLGAQVDQVVLGRGSEGGLNGPSGRSRPVLERTDRWRPLAGGALLERLRNTGRARPRADSDLAARLRLTLDSGLATGATPPLVVTKDRLTRVLACEAHQVAEEFGERRPTIALACGALVDVLFRQLVTVGSIGDPMVDALAALAVDDHQAGLVSWIEQLPGSDRDQLRAEVEHQAGGLMRRWPAIEPSWLPRTQESLRARVAGGAVELSARVDLAIGAPAADQASVAIVEVKSGVRRMAHRTDLHFYALIESLRSPAPPFVVATYYTRTGELDAEPVTEDLLMAAAQRALAGTRLLQSLTEGSEPRRTPNALCSSCGAWATCDVGRRMPDPSADGAAHDGERR